MHLAFLSSEYPEISSKTGGIGVSIMNLANTYIEMGHEVTVFVYGMNSDSFFIRNRIQFITIKNPKLKGLSWLLLRIKIKKIISKIHKKINIDFIEVPDWCGISAFMNFPFPIILKCNGSDAYFCYLESKKPKYFNYILEKIAFKNADYVFSVSLFCANISKKIFKSNREIYLIRNGFKKSLLNLKYEKKDDNHLVHTVLYFGTIIRKKGVLELPVIFDKVSNKFPNVKFKLIGTDSLDVLTGHKSTVELFYNLCTSKVKENTLYLKALSQQDLFFEINRSTVCVFPSFAEAFPLSWLEAMYLKKPIVASNIGWANEMIDDGINGLLAHPKNHQKFADYICTFLENPVKAYNFGNAARDKVIEYFDVSKVASEQINLFLSLKY